MTEPKAPAWDRRGRIVPCRYCGQRVMLCLVRSKVSERLVRRAVDLRRTSRSKVHPVAHFEIRREGTARRPGRTRDVNAWHLFTCSRAPLAHEEYRRRLIANYERRRARKLAARNASGGPIRRTSRRREEVSMNDGARVAPTVVVRKPKPRR